jgi:hypothetical protein
MWVGVTLETVMEEIPVFVQFNVTPPSIEGAVSVVIVEAVTVIEAIPVLAQLRVAAPAVAPPVSPNPALTAVMSPGVTPFMVVTPSIEGDVKVVIVEAVTVMEAMPVLTQFKVAAPTVAPPVIPNPAVTAVISPGVTPLIVVTPLMFGDVRVVMVETVTVMEAIPVFIQ